MRVLVVPKWYPWPDRPVFGLFCQEHARALARRHDVVVLASDAVRTPEFAAFALTEGVEDGLRTVRVRYRRPRVRPAGMAFQLAGMLQSLRRLRRQGWEPDIVHAHVYSAGLPAVVLARRAGVPLVITEHFTGFARGLVTGSERLVARAAFHGADLVAPVSADLAREIASLTPAGRVEVVPNVVDTNTFHPGPSPAGERPRLLSVGTLTAKKGHRDLLAAMAREPLRGAGVSLDLVGEGEERASLAAQAETLGVNVNFHGELLKPTVAELMRRADLFVLPSHYENLPVVAIEALASGLPVVATAVGGVPELVDEQSGVLSPPRDSAALAAAIVDALGRRAEFDREAMAARAAQRYGYDAVTERWTAIYERLAAR